MTVTIIRISFIHFLLLINGQALFRFYVFYLSDEFVEFYCLSGVKLHLLSHGFVRVRPYLRGLVHSPPRIEWQPYFGVSTQVSVYGRQSKIHFRARGTCRSYSLIRIAINEGH